MKEKFKNKESRREFVKKTLCILTATPFAFQIGGTGAVAQEDPKKALDEKSAQASALGYLHDASKVDKAKFPKKAEAGGDKQLCSNCMFIQKVGLKAEGQEGEWGKCALFMDGLVNVNGWCNSWTAKAA
jgi:hypothetical protein